MSSNLAFLYKVTVVLLQSEARSLRSNVLCFSVMPVWRFVFGTFYTLSIFPADVCPLDVLSVWVCLTVGRFYRLTFCLSYVLLEQSNVLSPSTFLFSDILSVSYCSMFIYSLQPCKFTKLLPCLTILLRKVCV